MSERKHDIVERLKIAQTNTASIYPVRPKLLQDAINEIVALREQLDRQPQGMDAIAHVRAEARAAALDEAALECEARFCDGCADAILALKDNRP